VAGQFVSRVFVVLLRKRFPQKRNLQTAAVLSVIKVRITFVFVLSNSLWKRSFNEFICLCIGLWSRVFSLSRLAGRAKFSAVLMKFVGFLKFILLGCSSIKSVRFLVGCMNRSGNFLRTYNHALVITSRSSSRLRRRTFCNVAFLWFCCAKGFHKNPTYKLPLY
jgi:hypothetical protein